MPRTAYGLIDNEPIRQRTAIVRAVSADGEHVRAAAHQQHRLLSHVADQLAAVRQFSGRDPERQIGADRLGLILGHRVLPLQSLAALISNGEAAPARRSARLDQQRDGHKAERPNLLKTNPRTVELNVRPHERLRRTRLPALWCSGSVCRWGARYQRGYCFLIFSGANLRHVVFTLARSVVGSVRPMRSLRTR